MPSLDKFTIVVLFLLFFLDDPTKAALALIEFGLVPRDDNDQAAKTNYTGEPAKKAYRRVLKCK